MKYAVKIFRFHSDRIGDDDGVDLPLGWEPLSIEAIGGNRYVVYARKLLERRGN